MVEILKGADKFLKTGIAKILRKLKAIMKIKKKKIGNKEEKYTDIYTLVGRQMNLKSTI